MIVPDVVVRAEMHVIQLAMNVPALVAQELVMPDARVHVIQHALDLVAVVRLTVPVNAHRVQVRVIKDAHLV